MADWNWSGVAVSISLISLCVSIYVALRDRGSITAWARYLSSFENLSDGILVHVVNSGRRPETVRRLLLHTIDGKQYEHKLERGDQAIRLLESEDYEFQINLENSELRNWAESHIVRAQIQSSRGKLYEVENLAAIVNANAETIRKAI